MSDYTNITPQQITKIEGLLKTLKVATAKPKQCGMIMRTVQVTCGKNDDMRHYFIERIARENIIAAAACVKEQKKESGDHEIVINMLINGDYDCFTKLVILFSFGEMELAKQQFALFEGYSFSDDQIDMINAIFTLDELNFGFIEFFCENITRNDEQKKDWGDAILSRIIFSADLQPAYLDKIDDRIVALFEKLKEYQLEHSYDALVSLLGIQRIFSAYGHDYERMCSIIDDFDDSNKVETELMVCDKLFDDNEEIFEQFRNRYLPVTEHNIKWLYISIFLEILKKGDLKDNTVEWLERLKKYEDKVSTSCLKDEKVYIGILDCVQYFLKYDLDVVKLIRLSEPVNGCRESFTGVLPHFTFTKLDPFLERKTTQLIEWLTMEHKSAEALMFTYANSYLKYTMDLNLLISFMVRYGYENDEINEALNKCTFLGKVKFKSAEGLSVNFRTAKTTKKVVYKDEANQWKGFREDDRVACKLINSGAGGRLVITDIWKYDREGDGYGEGDADWEKGIAAIRKMESGDFSETLWGVIIENSDVPVVIVQELFEDFTEALFGIRNNRYLMKRVLASINWMKLFYYKNDAVHHNLEYQAVAIYEDKYVEMIKCLINAETTLCDLCAIYINTVFKTVVPLNVFFSVLCDKFEKEEILEYFKKKMFYGVIWDTENEDGLRSMGLQSIKSRNAYYCEKTEAVGHGYFSICDYDKEKSIVIFKAEVDETRRARREERVGTLLRVVKHLSEKRNAVIKNESVKKLKEISVEDYKGDVEVNMKLCEYVKRGINNRRHNTYMLTNLIKTLSFRNPYCARKTPDYKVEYLTKFRFDKSEYLVADEVANIVIHNTRFIGGCFFIFVNSYLKLNISVEDFYKRCMKVDTMEKADFVHDVVTIGKMICEDDKWYYIPEDISIDKKFLVENYDHSKAGDKVFGTIRLTFENGQFSTDIIGITSLDYGEDDDNGVKIIL